MNFLESLIRIETLKARLRAYGESPEEIEGLFQAFRNKAEKSKLSFFDFADMYVEDLLSGKLDLMKYLE